MNILLLSPIFVPITCEFFLDLQSLYQKYYIENKLTRNKDKDSSSSSFYLSIEDPTTFSNLSRSEYIFLDKSGTLTSNDSKVEALFLKNQQTIILNENNLQERKSNNFEADFLFLSNIKSLISERNNSRFKTNFMNIEKVSPDLNKNIKRPSIFNNNNEEIENVGEILESNELIPNDPSIDEKFQKFLLEETDFKGKFFSQEINNQLEEKNILEINPNLDKKKKNSIINSKFASYKDENNSRKTISPSNSQRMNIFYNNNAASLKDKEGEELIIHSLKSPDELNKENFFQFYSLCHDARVSKEKTFESSRREEIAILDYSKKLNCEFIGLIKKNHEEQIITLKVNKKFRKFFLIHKNHFSYTRGRFSILIKANYEEEGEFKLLHKEKLSYKGIVLIAKGSEISMKNRLEMDQNEQENLELILKAFYQKGLKPVIYAQKFLQEEEADKIMKRIALMKSSLISQTEELDSFADNLENKMQLVGVIALREEIYPEAFDFVKFLTEMKLKIWILTGDSKESIINVAKNLNLIDVNTVHEYYLIEEDRETLGASIRNVLNSLKHLINDTNTEFDEINIDDYLTGRTNKRRMTLNKTKNRSLILNGLSLNIILKDIYLISHFKFILVLMKKVLAFNLDPNQKKLLVKLVQEEFPGKPNVIAIGDGFNDNLMIKEASIGVEILTKANNRDNYFKSVINSGDIKISGLGKMKEILTTVGIFTNLQNEKLIFILFYFSQLIGFQFFLFNFLTNFSLSYIYDSFYLFLLTNCFLAFDLFSFSVIENPSWKTFVENAPINAFYESLAVKRNYIKRFFFKTLIESIFHASFTVIFGYFFFEENSNLNGKTFDNQVFKFIFAFSTLLIVLTKVFFF